MEWRSDQKQRRERKHRIIDKTSHPEPHAEKKSKYRIELLYNGRSSKPAPFTEDEKCTNTYEVIFTSKVAC